MNILSEDVLRKLEQKIFQEPNSGCWLWEGSCAHNGYALACLPGRRNVRVHRVMYEHFVGAIPRGLVLDHLCRVRCCVNPAHLEPVTHIENVRRGIAGFGSKIADRNRSKTHCPKGHPYTEENTSWRKGPLGRQKRRCRMCCREEAKRIAEPEIA